MPLYPTCVRSSFPHAFLAMAIDADADARSCCRALTLLVVTLGKLLFPARIGPVLMRLFACVDGGPPLIFEVLRDPINGALVGLVSRALLTAVPFLKLVAGGSGRGRLLPEGVAIVLVRLIGESAVLGFIEAMRIMVCFVPVRNSCLIASSGFIRLSGSHRRQRVRKSKKGSSSHLRTCWRVFDDGRRRRPFEDTVSRGLPSESKKSFLRVLFSMRCFSGGPKTSMMHASCSCSFSPGNIGTPVNSSAKIHPRLHMSMGSP